MNERDRKWLRRIGITATEFRKNVERLKKRAREAGEKNHGVGGYIPRSRRGRKPTLRGAV